MSSIKTRFRRLIYRLKYGIFSATNLILFVAIILCLVWTYQAILSISRNWILTERLAVEERSLALLKLETEAMELENAYYKTTEYQDLAARQFLDKKLPGEHLVSLPENSETAKLKYQTVPAKYAEKPRSNFEKWLYFLFPPQH